MSILLITYGDLFLLRQRKIQKTPNANISAPAKHMYGESVDDVMAQYAKANEAIAARILE